MAPTGPIQSPWGDKGDYGAPLPSSEGDSVVSRGTDPQINTGGEGAADPFWPAPIVPTPGGEETANSVSGLPAQPNRFEPSGTPPAPPDLTDRNPGTIDRR